MILGILAIQFKFRVRHLVPEYAGFGNIQSENKTSHIHILVFAYMLKFYSYQYPSPLARQRKLRLSKSEFALGNLIF